MIISKDYFWHVKNELYIFFSFQLFSKPELIMCSEFCKTWKEKLIFLPSSFFVFCCSRVHHHNQSHFILTWYHMPLSKPDNNRKRWVGWKPKIWIRRRCGIFYKAALHSNFSMHIAMWYVLFIKKCNRKLRLRDELNVAHFKRTGNVIHVHQFAFIMMSNEFLCFLHASYHSQPEKGKCERHCVHKVADLIL